MGGRERDRPRKRKKCTSKDIRGGGGGRGRERETETETETQTYFSVAGAELRETTVVGCAEPWRSPVAAPDARSLGRVSRARAARAGETPCPPWLMDSEGR